MDEGRSQMKSYSDIVFLEASQGSLKQFFNTFVSVKTNRVGSVFLSNNLLGDDNSNFEKNHFLINFKYYGRSEKIC